MGQTHPYFHAQAAVGDAIRRYQDTAFDPRQADVHRFLRETLRAQFGITQRENNQLLQESVGGVLRYPIPSSIAPDSIDRVIVEVTGTFGKRDEEGTPVSTIFQYISALPQKTGGQTPNQLHTAAAGLGIDLPALPPEGNLGNLARLLRTYVLLRFYQSGGKTSILQDYTRMYPAMMNAAALENRMRNKKGELIYGPQYIHDTLSAMAASVRRDIDAIVRALAP